MLIRVSVWLALAFLAASPCWSAPATGAAKAPAKAVLPSDLDEMAKVCHLVEAQREKMAGLLQQKRDLLAEWDRTNGPGLAAARKALGDAQAARKRADMQAARDQIDALEKARIDTAAKIDHDILNVLTTQQRAYWEAYKLFQDITEKFQVLSLTDAQLKGAKKICEDVANTAVPAFTDAEAEAKTKKERYDKAYNLIFEKVLTQEQRDAFLGVAAEPKKDEKPDKSKTKTPRKTR